MTRSSAHFRAGREHDDARGRADIRGVRPGHVRARPLPVRRQLEPEPRGARAELHAEEDRVGRAHRTPPVGHEQRQRVARHAEEGVRGAAERREQSDPAGFNAFLKVKSNWTALHCISLRLASELAERPHAHHIPGAGVSGAGHVPVRRAGHGQLPVVMERGQRRRQRQRVPRAEAAGGEPARAAAAGAGRRGPARRDRVGRRRRRGNRRGRRRRRRRRSRDPLPRRASPELRLRDDGEPEAVAGRHREESGPEGERHPPGLPPQRGEAGDQRDASVRGTE